MDIIGCRFKIVIDQKKKHMTRVCNLFRARVRSNKTILFFIVRVSLLSGGTVPTTVMHQSMLSPRAGDRAYPGGFEILGHIMLTIKLFDALISPILLYGSEIWGVDCNDQIEKDPAELVQIKFLKWLLGVNKYCSNNACRAETGRFPMKIEAQFTNFKFWLTLTKHPKHKLSQVVCNDMKSRINKELWSQKVKRVLDQIGLG